MKRLLLKENWKENGKKGKTKSFPWLPSSRAAYHAALCTSSPHRGAIARRCRNKCRITFSKFNLLHPLTPCVRLHPPSFISNAHCAISVVPWLLFRGKNFLIADAQAGSSDEGTYSTVGLHLPLSAQVAPIACRTGVEHRQER